jgi:hypothetical protein
MPTKTAPLQGMVDSFAAAASTPSRFSNPQERRPFSDPPIRNSVNSGIAEIGHRHVHGHGGVAMAQTATVPGDATVHKTEVNTYILYKINVLPVFVHCYYVIISVNKIKLPNYEYKLSKNEILFSNVMRDLKQ